MTNRGHVQTTRGRGKGIKFEIVCLRCGMTGHKPLGYLEKDGRKPKGRKHIVEEEPTIEDNQVIILQQEKGENLMMRKILVQCKKEIEK